VFSAVVTASTALAPIADLRTALCYTLSSTTLLLLLLQIAQQLHRVPPAADRAWTAATVHYEAAYDKLHEAVERSSIAYNTNATVKTAVMVVLALLGTLLTYYTLIPLLKLLLHCTKSVLRLTVWIVKLPFR
jgi:hypothetical protein